MIIKRIWIWCQWCQFFFKFTACIWLSILGSTIFKITKCTWVFGGGGAVFFFRGRLSVNCGKMGQNCGRADILKCNHLFGQFLPQKFFACGALFFFETFLFRPKNFSHQRRLSNIFVFETFYFYAKKNSRVRR